MHWHPLPCACERVAYRVTDLEETVKSWAMGSSLRFVIKAQSPVPTFLTLPDLCCPDLYKLSGDKGEFTSAQCTGAWLLFGLSKCLLPEDRVPTASKMEFLGAGAGDGVSVQMRLQLSCISVLLVRCCLSIGVLRMFTTCWAAVLRTQGTILAEVTLFVQGSFNELMDKVSSIPSVLSACLSARMYSAMKKTKPNKTPAQ